MIFIFRIISIILIFKLGINNAKAQNFDIPPKLQRQLINSGVTLDQINQAKEAIQNEDVSSGDLQEIIDPNDDQSNLDGTDADDSKLKEDLTKIYDSDKSVENFNETSNENPNQENQYKDEKITDEELKIEEEGNDRIETDLKNNFEEYSEYFGYNAID